jgi:hypothetical protein
MCWLQLCVHTCSAIGKSNQCPFPRRGVPEAVPGTLLDGENHRQSWCRLRGLLGTPVLIQISFIVLWERDASLGSNAGSKPVVLRSQIAPFSLELIRNRVSAWELEA